MNILQEEGEADARYREKAKTKTQGGEDKAFVCRCLKYLRRSDKSAKAKKHLSSDCLDRIAIENSCLLSGSGGGQLYHEQYDEHGVKIEHQCFT